MKRVAYHLRKQQYRYYEKLHIVASIFAVGQKVRVSSSAGTEAATITAIATNVSVTVDTLALNHTTTSPLITRMSTLTVTPTNCIIHIKVQGYCNLTNWYINLQGK
jgi:hypothetical protein